MTALVLHFPARPLLVAFAVLRDPTTHSSEALALATTLLVTAIDAGEPAPPTTLDRLVWLALAGPAALDLRRRLADRLAQINDTRVRGRALAHLRDAATPADCREIAARLLGER